MCCLRPRGKAMKPKAVYNKSARYDCISFVIISYRDCGCGRLIIVDFYDRRNEFSLGANHDFTAHTFQILIIDVFYVVSNMYPEGDTLLIRRCFLQILNCLLR